MWLIAEYEATSLFTLKAAAATSSGAKTLLVPTPYVVKMALLDVACRAEGEPEGRQAWNWLRELTTGIRPAERAVVTNLFEKVLKPRRSEAPEGSADQGPYQRTIAYREYVQLSGSLGIALGGPEDRVPVEQLARWMAGIGYLGRRGSFVQIQAEPRVMDVLPRGFVAVGGERSVEIPREGVLQMLDECDPTVPFDRVSTFSDKSIRRGKDRIFHHVVLPYKITSSSRGYTAYQRTDD